MHHSTWQTAEERGNHYFRLFSFLLLKCPASLYIKLIFFQIILWFSKCLTFPEKDHYFRYFWLDLCFNDGNARHSIHPTRRTQKPLL